MLVLMTSGSSKTEGRGAYATCLSYLEFTKMSQSLHLQTLDAVNGSDNKRRIVGFGTVKVKVSVHTT